MARINVFDDDAFSMETLLASLENVDYKPQFLGSLNLFESRPVRTRVVSVESRDNELALIQTTPIGAPPKQLDMSKASVRNFNTVRLAKQSRIMSEELQGIRAFGTESELAQVQTEVARRLARLTADMELTWEHHRLGAVQGILLDADGSTLFNYFTEFGVAQPAAVNFPFGTAAAGEIRPLIESEIVRPIIRAAKGAFTQGSRIIGLAGDDFWDELVNHVDVRTQYLNWEAAASLRDATAFGTFRYAGVDWINYRGTDDGSTVAIDSDEAIFFPDAAGVFEVAWGPAEMMSAVNQPGVPLRPLVLPDKSGRDAFVDIDVYSYPLFLCKRPLTLRRATMTT
jgi:hypothetical protein